MISNDFLAVMVLMAYYILGLFVLPAMLKVWSKLPGEIIRKMQHVCYSLSIFILLRLFSTWYMAVAAAFLLVLLAYPILFLIEDTSLYQRLLVERTGCKGELRRQLIYVQLSFAILIFIFWGLFGIKWRYLIVVAAMVWGFGDAAAALIGKFFGKKSIVHRWVEGVKTYEGTAAMIVTATTTILLFFINSVPPPFTLVAHVKIVSIIPPSSTKCLQ